MRLTLSRVIIAWSGVIIAAIGALLIGLDEVHLQELSTIVPYKLVCQITLIVFGIACTLGFLYFFTFRAEIKPLPSRLLKRDLKKLSPEVKKRLEQYRNGKEVDGFIETQPPTDWIWAALENKGFVRGIFENQIFKGFAINEEIRIILLRDHKILL